VDGYCEITDAAVPPEAWVGLPLDRFITTNVIWRNCHELITRASKTKLVIQLIFKNVNTLRTGDADLRF